MNDTDDRAEEARALELAKDEWFDEQDALADEADIRGVR